MSKSQLIRFCGWAFILGAISFMTILIESDAWAIPGSVMSSILLAVGLLGLRGRYGEQVGGFGRNSLLLGASGPLLFVIFIAMGLAGIVTEALIGNGYWVLLFGGPAITLLGLTLFGFAALRTKPMPRLNWLPLVAGIWYPVLFLISAGYVFTHNGKGAEYYPALQPIFVIQGIALCALGVVLVADTPRQTAMARSG